jgi:ankyrin repeat protein
MEREEQERQRQKEEDERRRKRESEKRIKRLLEAAFDGDNDEILTTFDEVFQDAKEWLIQKGTPLPIAMALASRQQEKLVHSTDANGNTPLSEAASGGHGNSIRLLIEKGADPNTKGQFDRTPLYRAAFAGHIEAVQILLRHGADPRLYASDGTTPQQIASVPGIEAILQEWDCSQTDILLEKMQIERERQIREDKEHQEKEANRLEEKQKQALKENESKQKQLAKAYEELNKRIYEHDKCMADGTMKSDVTLEAIHEAEVTLEEAKLQAEEAQRKLDDVLLITVGT